MLKLRYGSPDVVVSTYGGATVVAYGYDTNGPLLALAASSSCNIAARNCTNLC